MVRRLAVAQLILPHWYLNWFKETGHTKSFIVGQGKLDGHIF